MKKLILFIIFIFLGMNFAYSFEDVSIPYDTSKNEIPVSQENETPKIITGAISLVNIVPQGFFGTWKVISVQIYSNNPFMFNSMSVDFWKLEKSNNYLTLTNPQSGATATVTLEEVKDNTIKFVRKSETPYEKVVETPEITLNGENFYGTDTIVISSYKNDKLVSRNVVKFKIKGIKQSGASITDLISK